MGIITVYSDFVSPDAYLASSRAVLLGMAGAEVEWRAVEFEPRLPVTGRPLSADEQDAVRARLAQLERSLFPGETLPYVPPSRRPKTEAAVTAVAESYGTPSADDVRHLLMQAYWNDGADIGNPAVLRAPLTGAFLRAGRPESPLREFGYGVGIDRGPVTTEGWERIGSWRAEWKGHGAPAELIVLMDGATLLGPDGLERLGKEVERRCGKLLGTAGAGDPRRYPPLSVRPDARWLSWVGGPWRSAHRLEQS